MDKVSYLIVEVCTKIAIFSFFFLIQYKLQKCLTLLLLELVKFLMGKR